MGWNERAAIGVQYLGLSVIALGLAGIGVAICDDSLSPESKAMFGIGGGVVGVTGLGALALGLYIEAAERE